MKLSMRYRREWSFWIMAAVLLFITVLYTVFALGFLAKRIDAIFGEEVGTGQQIVRFKIDLAKEILQKKSAIK